MKFNCDLEKMMEHFSVKGAFLSVKAGEKTNTMTISWGFVGFMWGKPVFIAVVRPQRYTYSLINQSGDYTVSVPYEVLEEELTICGTQSGADIDKSKVVSFLPGKSVSSPVVAGCQLYYECKKLHVQQLDGSLLPDEISKQFYENDYHYMYFGEIVECYKEY